MTTLSFDNLKSELKKITNLDSLKKEANRVATELYNFDLQGFIKKRANGRMKFAEKKLNEVIKRVDKLQSQIDEEISNLRTDLHKRQKVMGKKMDTLRSLALKQKTQIEKTILSRIKTFKTEAKSTARPAKSKVKKTVATVTKKAKVKVTKARKK